MGMGEGIGGLTPGHEGGLDIRRDDGTLDCSFNWIARNGEVHLTMTIDGAQYGLANIVVDLTSQEAYELAGGLRVAANAAGPTDPGPPMSVVPPEEWTASDVIQVLEQERRRQRGHGHVLGERD